MGNFKLYVICVICVGYVAGGAPKIGPPIIELKESEHIISSQSNFNLTCQGKNPIIWTYPNETVEEDFFSKIEVLPAEKPNDLYPYLANLIIRNASFVDTGYYYCHDIDAEKDAEGRSSKIYIYVRDEEHLSTSTSEFQFLTAAQNSDAVIPCRPTSPDVDVRLINFNGRETFDRHIGFKIRTSQFQINCFCIFTRNGKFQEVSYIISVFTTPTSIEKPQIDVASNGKTSIGEVIILNCTLRVDSNVYFDMAWDFPDKDGLEFGRINYTKAYFNRIQHGLGWSALTVKNVTLKDAGNYTCTVRDHVNNTNSVTKEITVLKRNESHINLSGIINNITVNAGEPNVTWMIDIEAYPEVKVFWINNKGEKIIADIDMMEPKYKVNNTETQAKLFIFNVTLNDSGKYQLEAINEIKNKTLDLTLTVQDKPRITIISDKYHPLNGEGKVKCVATGYPLPEVKWFIKPCVYNNCIYTAIDPNKYSISTNKIQTNATVTIEAKFTGSVKCFASNALGNQTVINDFLVTDVKNGFNVWGIDDPSAVAAGDDVTLHCGASIYGYSDTVKWNIWINNTRQPIADDKRFHVKKIKTNYSHQISLSIDSIQLNDSGKFVCVARGLQPTDGENYYFNQTIIVRNPSAPTIIKTNLDESEMKIKAGTPVTLNCMAEGVPAPEIKWTKNDIVWTAPPNSSHITLSENNSTLSFQYLVDDDSGQYSCIAVNKIGSTSKSIRLLLSSVLT